MSSRKIALVALVVILTCAFPANAKWKKQYANSPLKQWFDSLASNKGPCCSFADGVSIKDVDWDTENGSYRVRLEGAWYIVPQDALVTKPNKFGPAVVWPYIEDGVTKIRCFMPGALT